MPALIRFFEIALPVSFLPSSRRLRFVARLFNASESPFVCARMSSRPFFSDSAFKSSRSLCAISSLVSSTILSGYLHFSENAEGRSARFNRPFAVARVMIFPNSSSEGKRLSRHDEICLQSEQHFMNSSSARSFSAFSLTSVLSESFFTETDISSKTDEISKSLPARSSRLRFKAYFPRLLSL